VKVHPLIAGAIISAVFALQAWTLVEVTNLGKAVAVLQEQVNNIKQTK
jgi:hypothetical protein